MLGILLLRWKSSIKNKLKIQYLFCKAISLKKYSFVFFLQVVYSQSTKFALEHARNKCKNYKNRLGTLILICNIRTYYIYIFFIYVTFQDGGTSAYYPFKNQNQLMSSHPWMSLESWRSAVSRMKNPLSGSSNSTRTPPPQPETGRDECINK